MSAAHKFLVLISYLTVVSLFLIILMVTYWMVRPYDLFDVTNEPMPIISNETTTIDGVEYPVVIAGQMGYFKYERTKNKQLPSRAFETLINDVTIHLASYESNASIGKKCGRKPFRVPNWADSGIYFLRLTIIYPKVNPVRSIKYEFDTQKFYVRNEMIQRQAYGL